MNLRGHGAVLLLSCYELGHTPMGLAWPAAFLRRAGFNPLCVDTSVQRVEDETLAQARFAAISVPMHTALRLGTALARRIRQVNAECHINFFGHYAVLNAGRLREMLADSILGGECEERLVGLVQSLDGAARREPGTRPDTTTPTMARLAFPAADYSVLPPLQVYAHLERNDTRIQAGYVEASRGCLHHCRHCPIPPVYDGRFFVVPRVIVLEQVRELVGMSARHITFGDPDFLNGPTHSIKIAKALHDEFPFLSFDFTAKIEHLIRHRRLLEEFRRCGCLFVTSAVESLSDEVLGHLQKGHTRADVFRALEYVRCAGLRLRPTFVSFTPWTTLDDYLEMLDVVEQEGLLDCVDPVQYAIRLLVPPGSPLPAHAAMRPHLRSLIQDRFTYEWIHPDPRMDRLHCEVTAIVEKAATQGADPLAAFARIREIARAAREGRPPDPSSMVPPPFVMRRLGLTEPWFC
jgi:radical SAM superfamily enzyme YgiQ (UPF0313 family)